MSYGPRSHLCKAIAYVARPPLMEATRITNDPILESLAKGFQDFNTGEDITPLIREYLLLKHGTHEEKDLHTADEEMFDMTMLLYYDTTGSAERDLKDESGLSDSDADRVVELILDWLRHNSGSVCKSGCWEEVATLITSLAKAGLRSPLLCSCTP